MTLATDHPRFYLGCAVWAHASWSGVLFPRGSRSADYLRLYSRRLTTVEGNTTFYAIPSAETVQRWVDETPPSFRFCFKLPRDISHQGPLAGRRRETDAFVQRMAPLGERLGPFFLQLPPGYSPHQMNDLASWLSAWNPAYRLAVEVRHPEWYAPQGEAALMALLEEHGIGRVLMDVRPLDLGPLPGAEEDLRRARDNKPDVPLHPLRSASFALVRYIGHPDVARNDPLIDEWAARVRAWIAEGTMVFFFMHCPVERESPLLCRALQRRLDGTPGVPPLPWESARDDSEQLTLF
ncbi:DUF72 domain-containing protein [Roseiflexus castenholzii]|jgi:uncharacterized protein YecE (DUF72 family)|uniref:DUF72 domain-containing protein n=1 Tax=Roseiflexus castenholzii (strain DSM 13941 / HLO8) TaxID=383372 RepID=A7NLE4_ROSCS|nr:DUF72 domain-containing protein [Roseiflexus castenholzii]ABU58327.1 protein of unknown function DUF72 [Roseiflexus castenholzii DSM 13941]